jgi:hypothetical protein
MGARKHGCRRRPARGPSLARLHAADTRTARDGCAANSCSRHACARISCHACPCPDTMLPTFPSSTAFCTCPTSSGSDQTLQQAVWAHKKTRLLFMCACTHSTCLHSTCSHMHSTRPWSQHMYAQAGSKRQKHRRKRHSLPASFSLPARGASKRMTLTQEAHDRQRTSHSSATRCPLTSVPSAPPATSLSALTCVCECVCVRVRVALTRKSQSESGRRRVRELRQQGRVGVGGRKESKGTGVRRPAGQAGTRPASAPARPPLLPPRSLPPP